MKIKIFKGLSSIDIENNINYFLKDNKNINIINITQSQNDKVLIISILYKSN